MNNLKLFTTGKKLDEAGINKLSVVLLKISLMKIDVSVFKFC